MHATLIGAEIGVDVEALFELRENVVEAPRFMAAGGLLRVAVHGVGDPGDLDAGLLDVAVREGRVDVLNDGRELVAVAGERMRIESGREATFEDIAAHDDYWEWVSMLAPAYDIENRSLLDFLRWAARETGYELVFATNGLRMSAMRTDLHGSVEGFEPTEAIGAVLSTTTFNYRFVGEKLVIYRD